MPCWTSRRRAARSHAMSGRIRFWYVALLTQIGHGLENDLRAIRVVHTTIIDTCQLFPHPRGLPFRLALRDLVAKYLGKIIQAGGSAVGHSSAEDAQTTLELVRHKWAELCT